MVTSGPDENEVGLGDAPKGVSNPFAHATNITLSVPEAVEVKLVDASALSDYETWFFLSSAAISVTAGFVVAAFQATAEDRLQFILFDVFLILMSLTFTIRAFSTRKKLKGSVKKLRFRVGDPIPDDPD